MLNVKFYLWSVFFFLTIFVLEKYRRSFNFIYLFTLFIWIQLKFSVGEAHPFPFMNLL